MNALELSYAITIGLLILSVAALIIIPMYLHYRLMTAFDHALAVVLRCFNLTMRGA
jgi:hypothetical protein